MFKPLTPVQLEILMGVRLVNASGVPGLKFNGAQNLLAGILALHILEEHGDEIAADFCQLRASFFDPRIPVPQNVQKLHMIATEAGRVEPS